nr:TPA_asm: P4 protein [Grapevine associated jivivirus 1]
MASRNVLPPSDSQQACVVDDSRFVLKPPGEDLMFVLDKFLALGFSEQFYKMLVESHANSYELYCESASLVAAQRVEAAIDVPQSVSPASRPESFSSGSSAGLASTLSSSKLSSALRASKWRMSGGDKKFGRSLPAGLCYARLFRVDARAYVVNSLGMWPKLSAVLAEPEETLLAPCFLEKMSIVKDNGRLHLSSAAPLRSTALDDLVDLSRRYLFPPGTIGDKLASLNRVTGSLSEERVDRDDCIGGASGFSPTVCNYPVKLSDMNLFKVFLAGSVGDSVTDWRDSFTTQLKRSVCVYDPRGVVADVRGKLLWERDVLTTSSAVVFCFSTASASALSLLQLGQLSTAVSSGALVSDVVVVCPKSYRYSAQVRAVADRHSWIVCDSVYDSVVSVRRFVDTDLRLDVQADAGLVSQRFDYISQRLPAGSVGLTSCPIDEMFDPSCGGVGLRARMDSYETIGLKAYQAIYCKLAHSSYDSAECAVQLSGTLDYLAIGLDCSLWTVAPGLRVRAVVMARLLGYIVAAFGFAVCEKFILNSGLGPRPKTELRGDAPFYITRCSSPY